MDLPCFSLKDFEERIKNETPANPLCDRIGQGDKDECQKGGKPFVDLLKVNIDHCPDHVKPDKDKCGSGGNYRDRFDLGAVPGEDFLAFRFSSILPS